MKQHFNYYDSSSIVSDVPEIIVEEDEKPKIHIDKDSIVMNDNTITDDEFFDDFFS